jgi:hypothetical protein
LPLCAPLSRAPRVPASRGANTLRPAPAFVGSALICREPVLVNPTMFRLVKVGV